MKLKLFLLLLIPVFINASDSKRLQETMSISKAGEITLIRIKLFDALEYKRFGEDSKHLAQIDCDNYFKDPADKNKTSYIALLSTAEKHRKKGYGSRLFKKAVAILYDLFPHSSIIFDACNLMSDKKEDLEKLVMFYQRLGAQKNETQKNQKSVSMYYPTQRAAIMAMLFPILEPEMPTKKSNDFPIGIIISYMNEKEEQS